MKPLSERDENYLTFAALTITTGEVGMKPLSERDENRVKFDSLNDQRNSCRNEATL